MTADYAPDAAILARVVADGLRLGVAGDGHAAYARFGRLGFRVPCTRTHHMR